LISFRQKANIQNQGSKLFDNYAMFVFLGFEFCILS
jgi:hypothetical protein